MASAFLSQQPGWVILIAQVIELVAFNSCSCYDSVFFFCSPMLYSHRQIPDFQNILPGLAERKKKTAYTKKPADNFCTGLLLHLAMLKQRLQGEKKVRVKEILCIVCPNQVA